MGFELGIQQSKWGDKAICTHYSEIDKYADSIYKHRFPSRVVKGYHTHTPMGDITKIRTEDLPDFTLLVGGFPCQSFSIAGKRRGFDDTRGTLFFEIARILKDKRPRYFLFENVRGLLSHNKGETFKRILEIFASLGYDVKWEVLNSKDFGVPQNRERIYIKGYFRGECGGEVLFEKFAGGETSSQMSAVTGVNRSCKLVSSDGVNGTLTSGGKDSGGRTFIREDKGSTVLSSDERALIKGTGMNHQDGWIYSDKRPSICLNSSANNGFYIESDSDKDSIEWLDEGHNFRTLSGGKAITTTTGDCFSLTTRQRMMPLCKKQDNYVIDKVNVVGNTHPSGKGMCGNVYNSFGLSPTLTSGDCRGSKIIDFVDDSSFNKPCKVGNVNPSGKGINGNVYSDKGVCPCLTTNKGEGVKVSVDDLSVLSRKYRVRRLTPVECERLQGFPDGWTAYGVDGETISNTQRYKCLGNAVTVNVVKYIFDNWDLNV